MQSFCTHRLCRFPRNGTLCSRQLVPLPPWMSPVLEAVRERRSVPWAEEAAADGRVQVTVNEYTPGVGIASHVDTHSAFEDGHATRAESAVLA